MNYYGSSFWAPTDLAHYGIIGMKWGVRRYQKKDGSLTNAGKKHYSKEFKSRIDKQTQESFSAAKKSREEWNSLQFKQHDHVASIRALIKADVFDSKEYKDYEKAVAALEKFHEDHSGDYSRLTSKEFDKLYSDWELADAKLYSKEGQLFFEKRKDLASAKLKDLGFSDDESKNQAIIDSYLNYHLDNHFGDTYYKQIW